MALISHQTRIAFGVDYYDDEAEAEEAGKRVEARGEKYNGGFFHGQVCGREPGRDWTDDGGRRHYAVTRA